MSLNQVGRLKAAGMAGFSVDVLGKRYTLGQLAKNVAVGTVRCAVLAAPILLCTESAYALVYSAKAEADAASKAIDEALTVGIGITVTLFGYKLFSRI